MRLLDVNTKRTVGGLVIVKALVSLKVYESIRSSLNLAKKL